MNNVFLSKLMMIRNEVVVANQLMRYDQIALMNRIDKIEREIEALYKEYITSECNRVDTSYKCPNVGVQLCSNGEGK